MRQATPLFAAACAVVLLGNTCTRDARGPTSAETARPDAAPSVATEIDLSDDDLSDVYRAGLSAEWRDWGWAPRSLDAGKPARINIANYGGWIVKHKKEAPPSVAVLLHVRAPEGKSEVLELSLGSDSDSTFPGVRIEDRHRRPLEEGLEKLVIGMEELNPGDLSWDRIKVRAWRRTPEAWLIIERLSLAKLGPEQLAALKAKRTAVVQASRELKLSIACEGPTTPISPGIYGIAFSPREDHEHAYLWELGATGRRWGGNPAERYNWKLGNAWNTAEDWFFRNLNYSNDPSFTWKKFLAVNQERGVMTALTVPILGFVAKDTKSYSFPVKRFGPQAHSDPNLNDAGNGIDATGRPIAPGPASLTSIATDPGFVGDWVRAISTYERVRGQGALVHTFLIGNEPMLWNTTHRDVHPAPVTYDQLLDTTLRYGAEVRRAYPAARIAGPALWGWTAYFYSAKDMAHGVRMRPDRRAHGDVPLLEWYLTKLREHEEQTGEGLLDAVSIHYYPQADVYNDKVDPESAALRIRSTRSLWDPRYVDESWINEPVRLIPRMKELIEASYPGRGLILGEYSFGGEQHMSGALALAEALGRFGELGVDEAYYWTYPAKDSPAYWAFRAYRDYNGTGGRFLEESLVTTGATPDLSLFASTNAARDKLVVIALNNHPNDALGARVTLAGCSSAGEVRALSLSEAAQGFARAEAAVHDGELRATLRPYSVNVFEVALVSTR
jgi:hypothetical protein